MDDPASARDPSSEPPENSSPPEPADSVPSTHSVDGTSVEQQRIGPYRILERIGTGGMGEVYRAEQTQPIRRTVALKIIKRGMDTREVMTRFEAERQALALMEHPNIARVFDAGSTPRGRPYFAMEYVCGERITTFCDKQRLTTRERLELFMQLCKGVQHAHQKAIIHRDLKPSNVLVTLQGERPVPKIIDFGVAKATAQKLTEKTMYTALGELIGTPEYMSPEQAEMTGAGVDTRTDVYSLGVILYELLTGSLPFEPYELRRAGFDGITRMIREQDPPRPSTRVSTLGARREEVARARQTIPDRLRRALRGDLDWITLRALEKSPARRYGTAAELAADLQRHLRHEPVLASPPSMAYRAGKFVRRHRMGVSFAVAVGVLLTGFAVTMGVLWKAAERARFESQARAAELEVVTDFQASMLSDIDAEAMGQALYADLRERVRASLEEEGASPGDVEATLATFEGTLQRANATDVALELLDEQVLERAARAIEEDFADNPLVQAALQQTLAETYMKLGQNSQAMPELEAALKTSRRVLGDDHPRTLYSINRMGALLISMGRHDEALRSYREALEGSRRVLGNDHPQTLTCISSMGMLLYEMGQYEEALAYYRQEQEGKRRVLGNDHPSTLISINRMGALLYSMGRYDEALGYIREALEGRRRVLGDDHKQTLGSISNMGVLLKAMGRYDEALVYYREALEGNRRVLGDLHPQTLSSINNMGVLLKAMGQYDEALLYYREALDGKRRMLGNDHPQTLNSISNLGSLLDSMGHDDEALAYYREALAGKQRVLGDDHASTLSTIGSMGLLLVHQGKHDEALALLVPAEDAARRTFTGDNLLQLGIFLTPLGRAQVGMGDFSAAQMLLNEAHEILQDAPDAMTEERESVLIGLVELHEAWQASDPNGSHETEAAKWRAKLAACGANEPVVAPEK